MLLFITRVCALCEENLKFVGLVDTCRHHIFLDKDHCCCNDLLVVQIRCRSTLLVAAFACRYCPRVLQHGDWHNLQLSKVLLDP